MLETSRDPKPMGRLRESRYRQLSDWKEQITKVKNTLNCELTAIFTMKKVLQNGPLLLYYAIKWKNNLGSWTNSHNKWPLSLIIARIWVQQAVVELPLFDVFSEVGDEAGKGPWTADGTFWRGFWFWFSLTVHPQKAVSSQILLFSTPASGNFPVFIPIASACQSPKVKSEGQIHKILPQLFLFLH